MQQALEILLAPFVACLILTGIHTYLGLHVVSRGVIFVDLALAQIAALGATFAFLLGFAAYGTVSYLYSLLFAFVGAAIFSISHARDSRVPQEAFIGITFAVASAATILIADRAPEGSEFIEAMLTGTLLWVPWATIGKTAVIYSLIGLFHWTFRKRFLMMSLDPQGAARAGFSLRWWDFLFYMSFGFVITSSVAIAGVLLVFSFLVIPSVIAMLFANDIRTRLAIGWCVGTVVSMVGLALSFAYDFPSGPAVVVTFGLTLVLAATARYLINTERRGPALARVLATVALVSLGLYMAFANAAGGTLVGAPDAANVAAAEDMPAAQITAMLESLRAQPDSPPSDLAAVMGAADAHLHSLLITQQVTFLEDDVALLAASLPDRVGHTVFEELAHHAADPWVRLRAAQTIGETETVVAASALIELLESDVPLMVKIEAAGTLRQVSGQSFGFDPMTTPDEQKEALARWHAWLTSSSPRRQ